MILLGWRVRYGGGGNMGLGRGGVPFLFSRFWLCVVGGGGFGGVGRVYSHHCGW